MKYKPMVCKKTGRVILDPAICRVCRRNCRYADGRAGSARIIPIIGAKK